MFNWWSTTSNTTLTPVHPKHNVGKGKLTILLDGVNAFEGTFHGHVTYPKHGGEVLHKAQELEKKIIDMYVHNTMVKVDTRWVASSRVELIFTYEDCYI